MHNSEDLYYDPLNVNSFDHRKILLIDDDPIVERLIETICQKYDLTELELVRLPNLDSIFDRNPKEIDHLFNHFDLILMDINFSGGNSGLDFWKKHLDSVHCHKFAFISSIKKEKFLKSFSRMDYIPNFVSKPIQKKEVFKLFDQKFHKTKWL